jgi:hypothetical protein
MEPPYINLCDPLGFPAHKGPRHYGLGENRPGAVLLGEMTQGGGKNPWFSPRKNETKPLVNALSEVFLLGRWTSRNAINLSYDLNRVTGLITATFWAKEFRASWYVLRPGEGTKQKSSELNEIDRSWLVVLTILKNTVLVNGKDYPRYCGK